MATHTNDDFLDLGVVLMLEAVASASIVLLAQEVAGTVPMTSMVHPVQRPPHITLFQGRFPLSRVMAVLRYKEQTRLRCKIPTCRLGLRPNGNVFLPVVRDENLAMLHGHFHRRLHPLTGGLLMDQFSQLLQRPSCSREKAAHIRKYGALLAGPEFYPHVTLGRSSSRLPFVMSIEEHSFWTVSSRIATLRPDGSIDQLL